MLKIINSCFPFEKGVKDALNIGNTPGIKTGKKGTSLKGKSVEFEYSLIQDKGTHSIRTMKRYTTLLTSLLPAIQVAFIIASVCNN